MSCILNIDTSTNVCSVAVSQDGACIFSKEDHDGPNHAVNLGTFVDEAMSFADSHAIPLNYVAVSEGPGSYTGLRIGCSTAKGLCYGRNVKLIAVPTLKILAVPLLLYREDIEDDALFCPMIDARRMEVYCAVYDRALREVMPVKAQVVEADTFTETAGGKPIYFFGNGAAKCKDVITCPNAHFIDNIEPLAKNMLPLANQTIRNEKFEDVAYFEPFYLKDFVATMPKKLL